MIRKLIALPAAFSIVPLNLIGRSEPHEHKLGMAAAPPCPNDWVYVGDIVLNGVRYCMYADPDGRLHGVKCPA